MIDSFQATRVRPTIEGTFAGMFDFRFMPDFGQGRSVVQDAWIRSRFNPAAQRMFGYDADEVVGLKRPDFIHDTFELSPSDTTMPAALSNSQYGMADAPLVHFW